MNETPEPTNITKTKPKLRWSILLLALIIIIGFGLICLQTLKLQRNQLKTSQQLYYLNLAMQRQMQDSSHNKMVIGKLSQKLTQNQAAWMIPEIKGLIWRANILLTLEHNVPTAITLLQMADDYVQHLHDPDLLNLHQVLNENIATLQQLPIVDVAKTYMQLQALSNDMKSIPLVDQFSKNKKSAATANVAAEPQKPLWKRFFIGTWSTIKTFLVIRHHQQSVQPLLSAQQHQITVTKLQILCAQAQWALLQRRNNLYHDLLRRVQQSIKKHFSQNTEATAKILQEVAALQKINVDVQPPKLDQAMKMIDKIERMQYQKFTRTLKPIKEN